MDPNIIGWDIGGAHIKVAMLDDAGEVSDAFQYACPLWQGMSHFHSTVTKILSNYSNSDIGHAITMTGELVDLFPNRVDGVEQLLNALREHIALDRLSVFAGPTGLVALSALGPDLYDQVASANWLASANYASHSLGSGLFVDIGSTTTDILLIHDGKVDPRGYSDYDRLQSGELVYTGVVRTPLFAVTDRVNFANKPSPLVAELFATMADVYRITGELPSHADQWPTADNGEKNKTGSARRLARMLGRDLDSAPIQCWEAIASYLRAEQVSKIYKGCNQQLSRGVLAAGANLVGAGVGRFLAKRLAEMLRFKYIDFSCLVSNSEQTMAQLDAGDCAPAVSVARLLHQQNNSGS